MAARLGEVLYLAFMGVAALLLIPTLWSIWDGAIAQGLTIFGVPALISAITGGACLYVLAGKKSAE
jgi:hypothetical protein